jgi:hypothetical protein
MYVLRNMCHLELRVGGMCTLEHGATGVPVQSAAGVSTRAFANHFFSRLKFVGLRSPNKNKYHSTPDTYDYSTDYFSDPYNSRDSNPTEPMNHGCGSRRE